MTSTVVQVVLVSGSAMESGDNVDVRGSEMEINEYVFVLKF